MHPPRGCGGVRGGAVGTQAARRRYTAVNEDHAMSPDAVSDAAVIRRYRRALIPMIAAALPLTLAGWLALYWLPPPLAGTENPGSRLLYALGWSCVAILLAFVTGIEAVAHRRLFSRAIDPLAGADSAATKVDLRYLQQDRKSPRLNSSH